MLKRTLAALLVLLLCISLAGCVANAPDKEDASAVIDSDTNTVIVAKSTDELENGAELSDADAAAICAVIMHPENTWIDDISKCAVSCCILITDASGRKMTYNYCDYGVFDDLDNAKTLTLTGEARDTVNEILSDYITLSDTKTN